MLFLLQEMVEAAPRGPEPLVVPLPLRVRVKGNPGAYRAYLGAYADSPRGSCG